MRILIVNPNTTGSMTEKIGEAGRAAASRGTEVTAVNPAMGPESIEGYYDEAFSVPGLLEEIRRGEALGFDGYVIACFDDTGLDAARTLAAGPVLGICEAAMHAATMLGGRFSVVTTLARSVPALEGLARRYGVAGRCRGRPARARWVRARGGPPRRYGVADRCRVRASDVPVLALEDPKSGAARKVEEEIRRAVREDGAECIVLGCAGMADLAAELSRRLGLPVIDGVAAATRMIEALVGLGLKTSKVGGYAAPLPKAYSGEFRRFAPTPCHGPADAGRPGGGRTATG